MPRVCLFMIRTALFWLLSGYTIGGLLMLNKALSSFDPIWSLRMSHIFMLMIGWLVQLSAGVMVWMMPRLLNTSDRGDLRPVWFAYIALNLGVILAASHPPLIRLWPDAPLAWMLPVAGVFMLSAAIAFVAHIWRRVRPFVELSPAGQMRRHESCLAILHGSPRSDGWAGFSHHAATAAVTPPVASQASPTSMPPGADEPRPRPESIAPVARCAGSPFDDEWPGIVRDDPSPIHGRG